jgi:hypothetical protein
MNRQQFYNWMHDPSTLDPGSVADLQGLIRDYPYFQTARLLHLINLKLINDYRYEQELRQTAALAADRVRLREWIEILENLPESAVKDLKETEPVAVVGNDRLKDMQLQELEEKIKASLREIELNKTRLKELIEEKKAISGADELPGEEISESNAGIPLRPLPKDLMLEEFINRNRESYQNRPGFFNPEESARKSIEENDDLISETLARLVAAQGKNDRAIKIYQKLMLKYPQKSSYFAAQIEKLRKES